MQICDVLIAVAFVIAYATLWLPGSFVSSLQRLLRAWELDTFPTCVCLYLLSQQKGRKPETRHLSFIPVYSCWKLALATSSPNKRRRVFYITWEMIRGFSPLPSLSYCSVEYKATKEDWTTNLGEKSNGGISSSIWHFSFASTAACIAGEMSLYLKQVHR